MDQDDQYLSNSKQSASPLLSQIDTERIEDDPSLYSQSQANRLNDTTDDY